MPCFLGNKCCPNKNSILDKGDDTYTVTIHDKAKKSKALCRLGKHFSDGGLIFREISANHRKLKASQNAGIAFPFKKKLE